MPPPPSPPHATPREPRRPTQQSRHDDKREKPMLSTVTSTDSALARRLIAHWQNEVGAAPVSDEPFQHFYSARIWPSDVYAQILRNLPPREIYQPLNIKQWVNADGVSTRDRLLLVPQHIERMDKE